MARRRQMDPMEAHLHMFAAGLTGLGLRGLRGEAIMGQKASYWNDGEAPDSPRQGGGQSDNAARDTLDSINAKQSQQQQRTQTSADLTRTAADVYAPKPKQINQIEQEKRAAAWDAANKSDIKKAEEAAAKKREKSGGGGGGSVTVIMPGSGQFITGGMTLGPSSRMSSASQQTYAPQEAYTPVYEAPKAPAQTYVKYDPAKDFWSQYDALVRSMPYGATSSANAAQWQGQDPSAAVLGTDWGGGDAQPLQASVTVTPSNVTTYPYPMYPNYMDPNYGMSMTRVLNVGGPTTVIPEGPIQEFF